MYGNIMSCTLGSMCLGWEAHQLPSPSSAFCNSLCIYGDNLCISSKVFQNPEALEHSPAHATFPNPSPFLAFLLGIFRRIKGVHTCLCFLFLLLIPLQQRRGEDKCPTFCLLRPTRLAYCLCFSLRDSDKRAWYSYTQHIIYSCK